LFYQFTKLVVKNKNIAYTVYAAGYVPSFNNLLDVTASQTVNIVLAAV